MSRIKVQARQLPSMEDMNSARWDVDETLIYLDKRTGEIKGETLIFDYDTDGICTAHPMQSCDAEEFARQQGLRTMDGNLAALLHMRELIIAVSIFIPFTLVAAKVAGVY